MSKIKLGKIFWANVDGQIESAQRSLNRFFFVETASVDEKVNKIEDVT